MKALIVAVFAGTLLFWNKSDAASPNGVHGSKNVAVEFNARTGEWKPAGPKPVVNTAPLTPEQRKAQRTHWTWQRVAMQPLRVIVMVAKIPLLPVGFVGYNGGVAVGNAAYGRNDPYVDMGSGIDSFDPGPAIDADLERLYSRDRSKVEPAPAPFKSELRADRATRPALGPKSASLSIPLNRQSGNPSTAPAKPALRPVAELLRPEISNLDLLLPRRPLVADLQLPGPLFTLKDESAPQSIHPDLQIYASAPSSIVSPSILGVVAVNLR